MMAAMCYSEPLSDWLEEKVESLFDELPSPECGQNKPIVYPTAHNVKPQPQSTQSLLQEFETVLGDVEACHQIYPSSTSTLTPPQSPPPESQPENTLPIDTQILVTLQPALQNVEFVFPQGIDQVNESINKTDSYLGQISGEWNAENVSLLPLAGDVASELAAVDEYVRSCAEDISPPSPVNSSGGSYLSSEDSVDDPDWILDSSSSNKTSNNNKQRNQKLSRNRHKPYSRSIEDRKNRKKEQNKNAATRYRQKKKQEIKEIVSEEQELLDYNKKLHEQEKELKREIGYLKGLMRDLFKAKGLIN
ncbi:activating transcription factor of chaperone isoform X2 [Chelonus insularis]|uniref:activating transcription factor of chaperone isoform X2 n=1 Tax=Chelonus insularis TaxID=460826 RepID=UPI001589E674|nr:activating transcription factor of chaperone isoform X2 [Chelonus insularis]